MAGLAALTGFGSGAMAATVYANGAAPGDAFTNAGTINQDLEKSKKQYDRATKEMVHGVRYSKKMLKEIKADAAEWGE